MDVKTFRHIFLKPPLILAPIKFALFPIALFVFFTLRILQPLIKVRLGCLLYGRIGHLAANTELYLRRRVRYKDTDRERHIILTGKPANQQLLKMIRRRIPVIKNRGALWMYNTMRSFIGNSSLWFDFPEYYNHFYEFNNIEPQLKFTSEEEAFGRELLRRMGIEEGRAFVCLNVRDNAYLNKILTPRPGQDWSYHDYRDADINNYLPAIKYLASQGIFVIRMGYIVKQELTDHGPYIIDYATKYRCDFGDIYLSAKCKFFLGGEGGLTTIPWIFNVPVAYANGVPPGQVVGWRKPDIFMSKKLFSRRLKRFLTFPEIFELGADNWFLTRQYEEAQIEVVENIPEEILGLVKEMNSRLDGRWVTTEEDERLQQYYRNIIPQGRRQRGFPSRISAEFLRLNRELLGGFSLERMCL